MHRIYREWCEENTKKPSSRMKFTDIVVNDMNIAIHNPRKDQCDVCIGHNLKLVPEDETIDDNVTELTSLKLHHTHSKISY